jgi:hypothetical protein
MKYLAPVHSMEIYLKKYKSVTDDIAMCLMKFMVEIQTITLRAMLFLRKLVNNEKNNINILEI